MAEPEEEPVIKLLNLSRAPDSLFDGLHENEEELSEIESHLDELLVEEEAPATNDKTDDESIKNYDEEDYSMEEEHMESIEDFDDIEKLEIRHRNFDGESDDY
jgi:hypothetical protein